MKQQYFLARAVAIAATIVLSVCVHAMTASDSGVSRRKHYEFKGRLFRVSNTHVNKIIQDHTGYIWMATDYGLTRFDGSESVNYVSTVEAGSLLGNSVLTVMEDSGHNLWVGTTGGIQKFNRSTSTFTTPRLTYPGIPAFSYVNSIIEDRRGNIWFTTSRSGVVCMEPGEEKPRCFMTSNSDICSDKTTVVFEDKFGAIWIGSMDGGVTRYEPSDGRMTTLRHNADDASSLSSDMVFSITQSNDGRIFIASIDGGVDCYDYRTNIVTRNAITVDGNVYMLRNIPEENAIYIGTDGNGLFRHDISTGLVRRVEVVVGECDLSRAKIHDILPDRQGNMWLGVYQKGALLAASGENENVLAFGYKPFAPALNIGTEPVLCALQTRDGALWVGTDGDGLYMAPRENEPFRQITASTSRPATILCLFQDSRGGIWAGSYLNGLTRYNAAAGCFVPVDISLPGAAGKVKEVNVIAEDSHGNLWCGTNGNGICVYNPSEGIREFYSYLPGGDAESRLSGNSVHAIVFDSRGRAWIGTSEAGLSVLDPATGECEYYNTLNQRLSNDCVYSICVDASGAIWVATNMGLNRIRDNSIKIFNETHGLADNLVYSMVSDNNGNLWLGTGKGICRLDIKTMTFDNPLSQDASASMELKRGSVCKGTDGSLYFGGTGGMLKIAPDTKIQPRRLLHVGLNSLKIINTDDRRTDSGGSGRVIPLGARDKVTLDYDDNSFTLAFSAIEYLHPERVGYSVMLEGHDKTWIDLPHGSRVATWSFVPPGEYPLKVRASINGFSPIENMMTLVVKAPFYLSWWAKTIYVLLFFLAVWLIYRLVRWKIMESHRRHRENLRHRANELKLQYFTDISHEIRTPLTLILTPLESLKTKLRDRESIQTIDVMISNGNRILKLIDQIMDLRRFDNDRMSLAPTQTLIRPFIEDVSMAFDDVSRKKGILFSVTVSDDVPEAVRIDADKIDKVLFNVVGNAIKFTAPGGSVSLSVDVRGDKLEIRVADTGTGIAPENHERVFERFFRERESGKGALGTGIGLHLSRKLITLHGGSICVESSSSAGTVFLISVPLECGAAPEGGECGVADAVGEAEARSVPGLEMEGKEFPSEDEDAMFAGGLPKHATVLVVEDDDSIRNYLARRLSAHFNIITAEDGASALELALERHPDLILTDVIMDGVDGLGLCRKVRANSTISEIPVVMLTAKVTQSQQNEGILAGADAYITKPFKFDYLLNRINMLIHSRRKLMEKYSGSEAVNEEVVKIKSNDERLFERVRRVVLDDIANPDLSVEFIAEKVGVSRSHLHRRLKIVANMNPSEFIRAERMRHAAQMLLATDVRVSEVAYATGFSTLSHFSTCFKEHFGVSPSRYVIVHRRNETENS